MALEERQDLETKVNSLRTDSNSERKMRQELGTKNSELESKFAIVEGTTSAPL